MLQIHRGKSPTIDPSAYVAPTAVISGDVTIGSESCVHVRIMVPEGATVPIGWVAVGDPAEMFSPDRHEEIWAALRPLNFPGLVYGVERGPSGRADMREIALRVTRSLLQHRNDRAL